MRDVASINIEKCETCIFYDAKRCHRNPPITVVTYTSNVYHNAESAFPVVKKTDWCGEWRREF